MLLKHKMFTLLLAFILTLFIYAIMMSERLPSANSQTNTLRMDNYKPRCKDKQMYELLRTKVLYGKYPKGHRPQRDTQIMPIFSYSTKEIDELCMYFTINGLVFEGEGMCPGLIKGKAHKHIQAINYKLSTINYKPSIGDNITSCLACHVR